jgi:hypothetical protein
MINRLDTSWWSPDESLSNSIGQMSWIENSESSGCNDYVLHTALCSQRFFLSDMGIEPFSNDYLQAARQ